MSDIYDFNFRIGSFFKKNDLLHIAGYREGNVLCLVSIIDLTNSENFYKSTNVTSPLINIRNATQINTNHYEVSYKNISNQVEYGYDGDDDEMKYMYEYMKLEGIVPEITPWDDSAMFWDCETYSPFKDFTQPERAEDVMISISAIFTKGENKKGYLLLNNWGVLPPMREANLFEDSPPYSIETLNYKNEYDMISGFVNLMANYKPHCVVDFNGKSYDIPYLLERMKKYKIRFPSISPVGTESKIVTSKQIVMGQYKLVKSVKADGVLFIDLLNYMKLWFEDTPNHKLDTFSRFYLGEGKTGLTIPELFEAYETKDSEMLLKGAEYSMRDSIVLEELWKKVRSNIELSSSFLGIDPDSITTFMSVKNICNKLFSISGVPFEYENGPELKSTLDNLSYKGVLIYTYEPRMIKEISNIGQKWSDILAERLSKAPLKIVSSVYECLMKKGYINRNDFIKKFLPSIRGNNKRIICYGGGLLYLTTPPPNSVKGIDMIDFYETLINIKSIGKIIQKVDDLGKESVNYYGNLTKNQCPLIKLLFSQIVSYINGKINDIKIPELQLLPISDFVYTRSIGPDSSFDDIYIEARKRSKNIMLTYGYDEKDILLPERFPISWVVTTKGPSLYENGKSYMIDYDYYEKMWSNIYDKVMEH